MKFFGKSLLLITALSLTQNLMANDSCLTLVNKLQEVTVGVSIVDGRENELRFQLSKANIKDEKIIETKQRIEYLQKVRLQQNEAAVEAYLAVSDCLKK